MESLKSSLGDIQKSMEDRRDQAKRMQDVEDISKSLTSLSEEYERRLGELKHLVSEICHQPDLICSEILLDRDFSQAL